MNTDAKKIISSISFVIVAVSTWIKQIYLDHFMYTSS